MLSSHAAVDGCSMATEPTSAQAAYHTPETSMGRLTVLASLAILAAVSILPAIAQSGYPPPRGQSLFDAQSMEANDIMMCTPRAQRPSTVYGRTLAQEIAEGVAAGLAAQAQPDPECLARARAQRPPIVPSTVYAVSENANGRVILYIGGTHRCGTGNPFVSQDPYGGTGYGCWTPGHDNKGHPGYHWQSEHNALTGTRGKRGIWGAEHFILRGK